MKKLAVLQPSYIPWLGYIAQINYVDVFIIYDNVQHTKNDWRNRNKIKTANGWSWLTIPVHGSISTLIKDVLIDNKQRWREKHLKSLLVNYKKALYFEEIFPIMEDVYKQEWNLMADVLLEIIRRIIDYLGINTKICRASELIVSGNRNERLVEYCKLFEATHYFTGKAATSYLKKELFDNENILVEVQEYEHPNYNQLFGEFIPYLSVLDLLFNHGKKSLGIIKQGNKVVML